MTSLSRWAPQTTDRIPRPVDYLASLPAPPALPGIDLAAKPKSRPPSTSIQNRSWHVGVAALVEMNRVGLRKSQHGRNFMGIREVIYVDDSSHGPSLGERTPNDA